MNDMKYEEELIKVTGGNVQAADHKEACVCIDTHTCMYCGQRFDSPTDMLNHSITCPKNPVNKR